MKTCNTGYKKVGNECKPETPVTPIPTPPTPPAPTCQADEVLHNGVCKKQKESCTIANGSGEKTFNTTTGTYGACTLKNCNPGFHKNGNSCESNTRACIPAIPNSRNATQTWNAATNTWNACQFECNAGYTKVGNVCKKDDAPTIFAKPTGKVEGKTITAISHGITDPDGVSNPKYMLFKGSTQITENTTGIFPNLENGTYTIKTKATVKDGMTGNTSEKPNPHASDPFTVFVCDNGTHVEGNACVPDKKSCTIANGSGEQVYNHTTKQWNSCEVKTCEPGYKKVGNACQKDENQFQCPTNLPRLNVTLPTDQATRSAWVEKIKGLKFIKAQTQSDEAGIRFLIAGGTSGINEVATTTWFHPFRW